MTQFYSHAIDDNGKKKGSKLLHEHLYEVGNNVEALIRNSPVDNLKLMPGLSYLLGVAHDFGKYTTYFQRYLLENKRDTSFRHHHGLISAVFAAYLTDNFLQPNNTFHKYLPLLAYFVILHHHGDLKAIGLDVVRGKDLKEGDFCTMDGNWRGRFKSLQSQIIDLGKNISFIESEYADLLKRSASSFSKEVKISEFFKSWTGICAKIYKLNYELLNKENEDIKLLIFFIILFLYSALIDSDKKDAAGVSDIKRKTIPANLIDKYRESSPDMDIDAKIGINGIRNEIYGKALQKIAVTPLSKHIFTLTAPTGTGKTLTSFSCALKLRKRIKDANGYAPRIIYSLPFTSIIDQNYAEIKKTLSLLPDFIRDENVYLIKHHHLADLTYKTEDEEKPISESLLLVESWESEIIVTTFIQLLHSIIGFKNRFLKKFHNITGSIILLDEVQNIPVEYWPLITNVFKLLTEQFGCYIILLTATKPLIFNEKDFIPLLNKNESYFKVMSRVKLTTESTPISIENFFSKFKDEIYVKNKSFLIVLNTIKSSISLYNMLENDDKFNKNARVNQIFYLSTNIIPKERAKRIREIKECLEKQKKVIVISTQVIEAGIDIDLDVVIRDIGPVDSIIQAAGRCNRGMGKRKGQVYVFNLSDGQCSYAKYVYGPTHYSVSHDILEKNKDLEEAQFLDLINQYFAVITKKDNQDASEYIWEAIKNLRFYHPDLENKSISDFKLIKENGNYVDVFVEKDEQARHLLVRYLQDVVEEKNYQQRQSNYFLMRKYFNSYVISVPKKLTRGLKPINDYFFIVPYKQLETYYENETGFKRIEKETMVF